MIIVLQTLGVIDLLRLRRVNRQFYQLSRLLIVWIHMYQRSTLVLPNAPNKTSAKGLEAALVLATQLDLRLASLNPVCRAHWILHNPDADHSTSTCLAGKYLVLGGHRGSKYFFCVNLEDHSTRYLRSHFAEPSSLISVSEATIDGLAGLAIANRKAGRGSRDCSVYFQPVGRGSISSDVPSPRVTTLTMPTRILRFRLFGHILLIGTVAGEVSLFNLSTQRRQDFRVNGPIEDLGIYGNYLIVHIKSTIYTLALQMEQEAGAPPNLIVHNSSFDVFLRALLPPSAAPHPLTRRPVINIVYRSPDTLQDLTFGSIIPEIGQEELKVETKTIRSADDIDDFDYGHTCLTCAGHYRALSLVCCWTGERKLFLSEAQGAHGHQVIHKELRIPHIDWDMYPDLSLHWDEVSGRVRIAGLRGSKIMVLEF